MSVSSPTYMLPRPPDPGYRPGQAEREHSLEVHALEMAVRGVVIALDPAEQSVVIADALAALELHAVDWCDRCRSSLPEGFCFDHTQGLALADAFRRHAYRRLPGRPLIEADL